MSIDLSKLQTATVPVRKTSSSKWKEVLNTEITLGKKGLNDRKKERFYSELHTLLQAGVDIRTALELSEEGQSKKDVPLFTALREAVVAGASLSEALALVDGFSEYEQFSIQIGEESGRLPAVLLQLTDYYQRKIKLRKLFTGALSYPVFVLFVSIGVVVFMLRFVVPMFADVLMRSDKALPALTQFVVDLSEKTAANIYYVLIAVVAIGGCLFFSRKKRWWRKLSSAIVIRIPLLGGVVQKVYLGRLAQALHLLTASRTPLTRSVGMVEQMIGFYPIECTLEQVRLSLIKGQSLNDSLRPYSIYPKRMVSLLKVAEEVNQLDTMFGKLADQYSDEVEHKAALLGSLLEPIMIIVIALVVGVILIAMYLPLFDMSARV